MIAVDLPDMYAHRPPRQAHLGGSYLPGSSPLPHYALPGPVAAGGAGGGRRHVPVGQGHSMLLQPAAVGDAHCFGACAYCQPTPAADSHEFASVHHGYAPLQYASPASSVSTSPVRMAASRSLGGVAPAGAHSPAAGFPSPSAAGRHHHHHQYYQQQHASSAPAIPLLAGESAGVSSQAAFPQSRQHPVPRRTRPYAKPRVAQYPRAGAPDASRLLQFAAMPDQSDIDEQYRLAAEYHAEYSGPKVGDKTSTEELAVEYAASNSSYAQKTQNLAKTHPEIRRIAPDGNCGWRSVLFGYFEILLNLRNPDLIAKEIARLTKLKDGLIAIPMVEQSGGVDDLGLFSEFEALLNELPLRINQPDPIKEIQAIFNNDDVAGHILYPLRMFASAYLRTHPDVQEFLVDQSIDAYCGLEIDVPDKEIDEIGLTAVYKLLLEPLGAGLEVYNLHTNPGAAVDLAREHAPRPSLIGGSYTPLNPPVIRLLFRPTHYDLIYKKPIEHNVQVQLAYGFDHMMAFPPVFNNDQAAFPSNQQQQQQQQSPPPPPPPPSSQNPPTDMTDFALFDSLFTNTAALGETSTLSSVARGGSSLSPCRVPAMEQSSPTVYRMSEYGAPMSPTSPLYAASPSMAPPTMVNGRLQDRPSSPPRSGHFPECQTNCHWNADFQPTVIANPEEYARAEKEAKRRRREEQSERTRAIKAARSCAVKERRARKEGRRGSGSV